MKTFLILDGNSVANRAFYGVRMLTTKEGLYSNAIYGFCNILLKLKEQHRPDYLAVAFDVHAPTFRHVQYADYKGQRKGTPPELLQQMPVIKELLGAMNIEIIEKAGYEADDVIGTIAKMCTTEKIQCVIATGDRDSLQLVNDYVSVSLASTQNGQPLTSQIGPEQVMEKYGVTPKQLIQIKGLMGDSSDNIPGVAGVGEKTAAKLVIQYGTIENIYENIDDIKGSLKEKLIKDQDMAYLSRTLGTIDCAVPLDQTIDEFTCKHYDDNKLSALLTRLEFKNLLSKLELNSNNTALSTNQVQKPPTKIVTLQNKDDIVPILKQGAMYSYYLFGGDALAVSDGDTVYFALFEQGLLAGIGLQDFAAFFEDPQITKITHDHKTDMVRLHGQGIALDGVMFDTMLSAYLLEPSRSGYDLGDLCGFMSADEFFGKGKSRKTATQIDQKQMESYAAQCVDAIQILRVQHLEKLEQLSQLELFYDMEMPLATVLAKMEMEGFLVDRARLAEFSATISRDITRLEQEIYDIAGLPFNINSPKQLGQILFEVLQIPVVRKTKTGYSTDAEVLEKLSEKYPIAVKIKEYRTLAKLRSTYAEGMLAVISPQTGRIHSTFNQTVTVTGRISSTEPNLQNIPVRSEIGREMRKMFVAKPGHVLVSADYSQIELRVLAHISGDERLIQAFKDDMDIHTITAAQVFHVLQDQVTPFMRTNAKAVNFGIVYGISDYALGRDLKITRKMAREYMDKYFATYQGVQEYMHSIIEQAKQDGYVTTLMGRRRYIPELASGKFIERSFGERVALNAPIQGTAADIIKIAMIRVNLALTEQKLKSKLILQVHDELIIETAEDEVQRVTKIAIDEMENAAKLSVPLKADTGIGHSWYDAK